MTRERAELVSLARSPRSRIMGTGMFATPRSTAHRSISGNFRPHYRGRNLQLCYELTLFRISSRCATRSTPIQFYSPSMLSRASLGEFAKTGRWWGIVAAEFRDFALDLVSEGFS